MIAYEVGQTITDTVIVRDGTGAAVNLGTAPTCTVTKPDGTTASAIVTTSATGTYAAAHASTMPGRHLFTWSSIPQTNSGGFPKSNLYDVWAADPRYLIGLEDARTALNLPAGVRATDEELRLYVASATPIVEDIWGPVLAATIDEQHDGGAVDIALDHVPVASITSVTEYDGATAWTLTKAANPAAATTYSYTVDMTTGTLTRRSTLGAVRPFARGHRNIWITYVVGTAGVTPIEVTLGTRELVRHLYQVGQQGARPAFGAVDDMQMTPSGFAVPRRVMEILKPGPRTPGVG